MVDIPRLSSLSLSLSVVFVFKPSAYLHRLSPSYYPTLCSSLFLYYPYACYTVRLSMSLCTFLCLSLSLSLSLSLDIFLNISASFVSSVVLYVFGLLSYLILFSFLSSLSSHLMFTPFRVSPVLRQRTALHGQELNNFDARFWIAWISEFYVETYRISLHVKSRIWTNWQMKCL